MTKLRSYFVGVRKPMSRKPPVAPGFQYSRLPENNIRLLRIKSIGNPPICELYDAPLNDDLRFRAISYAWGSDELTHRIKCNDMIMNVTESVADMFSSIAISALCVDMPIWVDAVCINQRDESEKAVQVRMMGSLYSRAEEVIVWLGPASDDSDYAMKQLNDWSSNETFLTADSLTKLLSDRPKVYEAGLKHQDDPVYNALEALFCRSWFTRLWVLQEIVLARRSRLFCGSAEITLEQLVPVSDAMTRPHLCYSAKIPTYRDLYHINEHCISNGLHETSEGQRRTICYDCTGISGRHTDPCSVDEIRR